MATDTGLTFSSQLQFLKQNISSPFHMLVDPIESGLKRKRTLCGRMDHYFTHTSVDKEAPPYCREVLEKTFWNFNRSMCSIENPDIAGALTTLLQRVQAIFRL